MPPQVFYGRTHDKINMVAKQNKERNIVNNVMYDARKTQHFQKACFLNKHHERIEREGRMEYLKTVSTSNG